MFKLIPFVALICIGGAAAAHLESVFAWKEVSFAWPSEEAKNTAVKNGDYIVENNLPLGLARWRNKLFVTVPRWKNGVASSLNYVLLNSTDKSPQLIPYPDLKANTLPKTGETLPENQIVSTLRVKVDVCDRLWVMDNALAESTQVSPPAILIFDLKTDKLVRRYNLKATDVTGTVSFFANIAVDVTEDTCDKAYAYLPDLGGYGLVVYSFADNDSFRITHNFFHFDPVEGDMNIGGIDMQVTDGLVSLALGPIDKNGFRTAYFHATASADEFSVSTRVLKNESLASNPTSYGLFKLEGRRGEKTQSTASVFDEKSNVLFLTQLQKDAVACWNPKKKLEPASVGIVAQDHKNLIFTNDLALDQERNLWILSDQLTAFFYGMLKPDEINYNIFKIPVDEAIKRTPCIAWH